MVPIVTYYNSSIDDSLFKKNYMVDLLSSSPTLSNQEKQKCYIYTTNRSMIPDPYLVETIKIYVSIKEM